MPLLAAARTVAMNTATTTNNTTTEEGKIVLANAAAAEAFAKEFYTTYDSRRHELVRFFRDFSVLVFNGNAVTTLAALSAYFTNLPATRHKIESVDAHPLLIPEASGQLAPDSKLFVSVVGTVAIEDAQPTVFHENFILRKENGVMFVVSDTFRLPG